MQKCNLVDVINNPKYLCAKFNAKMQSTKSLELFCKIFDTVRKKKLKLNDHDNESFKLYDLEIHRNNARWCNGMNSK